MQYVTYSALSIMKSMDMIPWMDLRSLIRYSSTNISNYNDFDNISDLGLGLD